MKIEICEAFCRGISVSEMQNGFAISTPYDDLKGNPLGFYALGPDDDGFYRVVDDGMTIPFLEAAGVSFDSETRHFLLNDILTSYGAHFSEGERQIYVAGVPRAGLADCSIRFLALLLRVQDLMLMTRERVESTDDIRPWVSIGEAAHKMIMQNDKIRKRKSHLDGTANFHAQLVIAAFEQRIGKLQKQIVPDLATIIAERVKEAILDDRAATATLAASAVNEPLNVDVPDNVLETIRDIYRRRVVNAIIERG